MSTLRLSIGLLLLMLVLGLVGCSSTSGKRSASVPKMRTIASIGDKPLPIVTGEPGDSMSAETERPDRRSRSDTEGQISGRVVDDRGEPVPDAEVRLAVNAAPGGRVVRVTTDRAGGFTLRGLRPGTTYTVIADREDAQGVMTGRSNVQAPDSDVRITLATPEPATADSGGSTRVNHVSRRDPPEEDPDDEVAEIVGSPINVEDLPPAPEADVISPATRRQVQVRDDPAPAESSTTSRARGWRRDERSNPNSNSNSPADDGTSPAGEPESGPPLRPGKRAAFPDDGATPDDDGPNPLPPALESGQASRTSMRRGSAPRRDEPGSTAERATAIARDAPTPLPDQPPGALVALPRSTPPAAFSEAPGSLAPPADLPPSPAEVASSGPADPGPLSSNDDSLPPPAEVASRGELLPPPAEVIAPGSLASNDEPPPPPAESMAPAPSGVMRRPDPPAVETRARPRWGDLAASEGAQPTPGRAKGGSTSADAGDPDPTRVARGSPKEPETFCRFDPKLRRIEDFRLPDLQGRPVRFHDFDSELILLDFWGTWCQPCVRSVPHLVDLQERLGGKQLQVVGIACEREETPPAQRLATVAQVSKKLGINYTVLVSSLDGTCPLQKALHVQAYPTLILVDRQGRILWQDQGATRTTMARLDRMLTMAAKPDGRRRY